MVETAQVPKRVEESEHAADLSAVRGHLRSAATTALCSAASLALAFSTALHSTSWRRLTFVDC